MPLLALVKSRQRLMLQGNERVCVIWCVRGYVSGSVRGCATKCVIGWATGCVMECASTSSS